MKSVIWLTGAALCGSLLMGSAAVAEEQPSASERTTAAQPAQESAPVDSKAMAILQRTAERLARAKRFSVSIRAGYDVVQESGQKIEFGERRTLLLSRPDGLRAEAQLSDGDSRLVVFDGKTITVLDPDDKVYAQVEKRGSVDDAVRYLVGDLQVRLPLALMLVTTLPEALKRRIQSLAYVEEDAVTEVPTDHLAGRTEDVDFQIWIAREGEPLPRRIVLTYKHEDGEPQFWAVFTDWNLAPEVSESQFAFTPPAGAERIPFLVRVRKADTVAHETGGQP